MTNTALALFPQSRIKFVGIVTAVPHVYTPGRRVRPVNVPPPRFRYVPVPAGRLAAAVYAVIISLTACVSSGAFVTAHVVSPPQPVYPASTSMMFPLATSEQHTPIAAPVIGEAPTFPVIADVGTFVIPDFVRMVKFAAVPRSIAVVNCATAAPIAHNTISMRVASDI